MTKLHVDLETYSSVDIKKSGAYAYAASPDFEILLLAYAYDDEPVKIIDLAQGEELPEEIRKALHDGGVVKIAHNANFERTCFKAAGYGEIPPEQWGCTAVHCRELGLPGSLYMAAKVLFKNEDMQKDTKGKALIKYFCVPCRPTMKNEGRTRNFPEHEPEKWEQFKNYCIQDVVVEREIDKKLSRHPVFKSEQTLWELDQEINDRGCAVDMELVYKAIKANTEQAEIVLIKAKKLTGLDNPNSLTQLKDWLSKQGLDVKSLDKDAVSTLLSDPEIKKEIKDVLELRRKLGKTSVKKYEAIERSVCPDGRVRGLLMFYGANRTGRWAGRLVQIQNLPQNHIEDLGVARDLVRSGNSDCIEMLYGSLSNTLSQLIRTAFIPTNQHRFIVSDFSAIEARVIAWLAGETWRQKVFATHGKIYEASAAQIFKVPIQSITKGSELRQKGKVAELALGFGGGPNALISMGALDKGLKEEDLPRLVKMWRNSNPNIVKFWSTVEMAAKTAIAEKRTIKTKYINFTYETGILFIQLPSGRKLAYQNARIDIGQKFNRETVFYDGMEQTKRSWGEIQTFGGKLAENIVQATARDCLAYSMKNLAAVNYNIVMHVHDEVVLDVHNREDSINDIKKIMGKNIPWAPGLLLTADAYETNFYRKD